jgi:hypothetical protein
MIKTSSGQTIITTQIQNSILYTTYNPDTILSCGNSNDTTADLFFDINNDGIPDFQLELSVLFTDNLHWDSSLIIFPLDISQNTWSVSSYNNAFCADSVPVGIDSGEVIEDTLDWMGSWCYFTFNSEPNMLCTFTQPSGFKYYPIRLINSIGDKYFGWIYLSSHYPIILKETAICLIPNQPIYTAHQGLYYGIPLLTKNDNVNIFPNPSTTTITISAKGINTYILSNTFGQVIKEGKLNEDETTIAVSALPNGIYILALDGRSFYKISVLH